MLKTVCASFHLFSNEPLPKWEWINNKGYVILFKIQRVVISGGNFKPDTLKPKEVVSLLLDDDELEKKREALINVLIYINRWKSFANELIWSVVRQRQEEKRQQEESSKVKERKRKREKYAEKVQFSTIGWNQWCQWRPTTRLKSIEPALPSHSEEEWRSWEQEEERGEPGHLPCTFSGQLQPVRRWRGLLHQRRDGLSHAQPLQWGELVPSVVELFSSTV